MDPTSTPAAAATRSNAMLIVVATIALAVGLLIGAVIGWQVEKSRVESDVDRLREKLENLQGRSLGDTSPIVVLADGSRLEVLARADSRI